MYEQSKCGDRTSTYREGIRQRSAKKLLRLCRHGKGKPVSWSSLRNSCVIVWSSRSIMSLERTFTNSSKSIIHCVDDSLVDVCESRSNVSRHDGPNDTEMISVVRHTRSQCEVELKELTKVKHHQYYDQNTVGEETTSRVLAKAQRFSSVTFLRSST